MQMEVECALLVGEQESEMAQLQKEKERLEQLKETIYSEKKSHAEKSQVHTKWIEGEHKDSELPIHFYSMSLDCGGKPYRQWDNY